jgi:hypothetical protein
MRTADRLDRQLRLPQDRDVAAGGPFGDPSLSPSARAVMPEVFWMTSSASSARAVGLTSCAIEDSPGELMALWRETVDRSRTDIADGGLDRLASFTWPDGRTPSLRRLLIDMVEEYARHVGHADLIRESVDGLVGEDPE